MAAYHRTGSSGGRGGGFSGTVPRRSNPSTGRLPFSTSTLTGRPHSFTYSPLSSQSSLGVGGFGIYGSSPTSSLGGYGNLSTYGGTTSGYGGLTLLTPSSSNISLSSSPTGGSHYNSYLVAPGGSGYARNLSLLPARTGSNRQSRASPLSSYVGSRSSSLTSLPGSVRSGSEGYASGSEYSGHSSRLGSATGASDSPHSRSLATADAGENGEVDYKKLYEQAMEENDRLREKLKKTEDTVNVVRTQLESATNTPSKNSFSELEKRERRAMERKLSEMEEELKQLQKLKAENERLKAENRALTRVVSKLTNSANATK